MNLVAIVPMVEIAGTARPAPDAVLAGRALCDWAIRPAVDSGCFARVVCVVRTAGAAEVAKACGAEVLLLDETPSSLDQLLVQAGERLGDFDGLALVDPASPLTHPEDIRGAVAKLDSGPADSVVAVARKPLLLWEEDGTPMNYDPLHREGSIEGEFVETESLYVLARAVIDDTDSRLGGRIAIHEVPAERSFRIASDVDLEAGAVRARRYGYSPAARAVKLIVLDVDGVLTDAGFYYSEEGESLKKFNTRDGAGIMIARKAGAEFGIITGESTGFAPARAAKLKISRVELGCSDKLPVLDGWRRELGLEWSEVVYMGDDLPDLPCVRAAGVGACPRNAEPEVRAAADFVSSVDGGQGCVRDLIRHLCGTGRLGAVSA